MNDVYVEYDTGKMPVPVVRIVVRNVLITAGVLLILYAVLFYPILWTVGMVLLFLAYFYNRGNNFQYEYLLLNDELHVDRIIANLKRKKAFRGNLQYMEIFTNDKSKIQRFLQSGKKVKVRKYADPKLPVYYLVLRNENTLNVLEINADDKLIQAIRRLHPLQVAITPVKKQA